MPEVNNGSGAVADVVEVVERRCQNCDDVIEEGEDMRETEEYREGICTGCFENDYIACEVCRDIVLSDNAYMVGDDWICRSCERSETFCCNHCGDRMYNSEVCECDGNVEEMNDGGGEGEDFRARGMTEVLDTNAHTFGVEIEVENGRGSELSEALPKSCGIHSDGSLSNGAEIVTPPLTKGLMDDYIPMICKSVRACGYEVTDSCGLHVHVKPSVASMGAIRRGKKSILVTSGTKRVEAIKAIVIVARAFEPVMFSMLPASRISGRWCKPIRENRVLMNRGLDVARKCSDFENFCNDRYYGVNLCALKKYGTIEFRHHSGTIDDKKIIMWIGLISRIIDIGVELARWKLAGDARYEMMLDKLYEIESCVTIRERKKLVDKLVRDSELSDYMSERMAKFAEVYGVGGAMGGRIGYGYARAVERWEERARVLRFASEYGLSN